MLDESLLKWAMKTYNTEKTLSDIVWQKIKVFTSKKYFKGGDNFQMTLPDIPGDATYALADIFITVGAEDHIVFNFAADAVPSGEEYLSRGQDPNSIFKAFGSKHNHLSFNYAGQSDGYSPYYGMWYSSQHLPIKNGKTNFRTNGASSTSAGYVWVRVRAYSKPNTNINDGLLYQEVKASFVEWKFSSTHYGSQSVPSTVPTDAEYALCDLFFSSNKNDHQNFAFSDEQVGEEKNWVDARGQNPEGQFNAKTQKRQEVTVTYNGESDGFTQHYGIWWSSQILPIKSRKFYWGNYGNSGSTGYIFMRVRGYYAKGVDNPIKWKKIPEGYVQATFTSQGQQSMELPGVPSNARYALVDVFMTNSKNDHYNVDLGRDKNDATAITSWITGGGRPSSSFPTQVGQDQGALLTYFGEDDNHSSFYGLWYSSQIISTNGAVVYHQVSGNYHGGTGYTYLRVHAYGY